jgi:hypothetical protein
MNYTPRQARRELERINTRLKGFSVLLERKRQLETFLSLAEQLSRKPKGRVNNGAPPIRIRAKLTTSDAAALVLKNGAKIHLKQLHEGMRAIGWAGSGNVSTERLFMLLCSDNLSVSRRWVQTFGHCGRNKQKRPANPLRNRLAAF